MQTPHVIKCEYNARYFQLQNWVRHKQKLVIKDWLFANPMSIDSLRQVILLSLHTIVLIHITEQRCISIYFDTENFSDNRYLLPFWSKFLTEFVLPYGHKRLSGYVDNI